MDFNLTSDQKTLQTVIRSFINKRVIPNLVELRRPIFPKWLFDEMAGMGLAGIGIPEQYGGSGQDVRTLAMVTMEIARGDAGLSLALAPQSLAGEPILLFGTDAQKEEWLPPLASGEILGAYAQTETGAGSDVAAIATTAKLEGDELVINGTKTFITNGSNSKLLVVLARMMDAEKPHHRLGMVIVDAERAKRDGALFVRDEVKMGIHCSMTSELGFVNCRVPAKNILGFPGMGFKMAMVSLTNSRIGIAAQSVGVSDAAYECAVERVVSRTQFGRPIGEFQLVHAKIAEMATRIEAARLLTYRAAALADLHPLAERHENVEFFTKEASMAKFYASETAKWAASEAADMHGGMGFMADERIAGVKADSGVLGVYEGTSNIQQIIIARQIFRPMGLSI